MVRDVRRMVVVSHGVSVSLDTATTEIVENPEFGMESSSNVWNSGSYLNVVSPPQQPSRFLGLLSQSQLNTDINLK